MKAVDEFVVGNAGSWIWIVYTKSVSTINKMVTTISIGQNGDKYK